MSYSYTVTRTLDAPAADVWNAWTDADAYATWANAVPGSVSLDVRPGGAFSSTMKTPDGQEVPVGGEYREVEHGRRLVMAMFIPGFDDTVMDFRLAPQGDKTEVTISQECATPEMRDGAEQGTNILLDWCAEYLSRS